MSDWGSWRAVVSDIFLLAILVVLLFDINRRIARLESKVESIGNHLGLGPAKPSDEVIRLVAQRQKIEAIKQYRKENPEAGLREAKEVVDAVQRELGR
jgi:ribosomal protein L7/L12